MSRRTPCLALLLAALAASPALAGPGSLADLEHQLIDLAEQSRQRTVLVYGLIGMGSGAVVSHDGVVVTNAHVMAASRYAVVQWSDGSTSLMHRRGIDYGRDLSVLEPAEPLDHWTPAFSIEPRRPHEGDWVLAVGYPGGPRGSFDATVTLGKVLPADAGGPSPSVAGVLNYADAIVSDAPIFSGNSGGPLVDMQGRLLGINGAGNLEQATSLSIPSQLVLDRLQRLQDERILLPGERELKPNQNPLLHAIYRALDPLARQIPARTAQAARKLLETGELELDGVLQPDAPWTPEVDFDHLAELARQSPRQQALAPGLAQAQGALWLGDVPATRVAPRRAVCKASRVGNREQLTTAAGEARVLAVSAPDDLALLELPAGLEGPVPAPAPACPTGTLAFVPAPQGPTAAGIVSAGRRPTSATLAAQIQHGGMPDVVLRLVDGLERLAERLNNATLRELVAQIREAIHARQAFSAGTPPHSYPVVLSVDVPVPPSQVGAPALDREGRLLGVTVGVPHHGTTYVVPLDRVRQVFFAELGQEPIPSRMGKARLY